MTLDDPLVKFRAVRCSCCGRDPACPEGDINIVTLMYAATWDYPPHGNVLSGTSGLANAVFCLACTARPDSEAREAIEFRPDGGIVYHPVSSLEDWKKQRRETPHA